MISIATKDFLYLENSLGEVYTTPLAVLELLDPEVEYRRKCFKRKKSTTGYQIGARYYDPDVAVWTSVDKARQHFSAYTYGSNNPVNRVDPDGNMDVDKMREWANWAGGKKGVEAVNGIYGLSPRYELAQRGINRFVSGSFGVLGAVSAVPFSSGLSAAGSALLYTYSSFTIVQGLADIGRAMYADNISFSDPLANSGPFGLIGYGVGGESGQVTGDILDFSYSAYK